VRHVLELLKVVYRNDAAARERGMSKEERLEFHKIESGPVMEALKEWLEAQIEERKVEPNSGLGKAIAYMQKRWEKLTLFLRVPGAPLDNTVVERALKRAILHRNHVHQRIMWRCARKRPEGPTQCRIPGGRGAHNQSASRKARRRSLSWYGRLPRGGFSTFSIARFFIVRSASTYMWVVAVLSCPSQRAMTVMSTPD
jgi:transposase IS66 family protein